MTVTSLTGTDWNTFDDFVRPSTKPVKLFLRTNTPGLSPLTAFSFGGCTPNEQTEPFEKICSPPKYTKIIIHTQMYSSDDDDDDDSDDEM